jgi:hypothetical protein
VQVDEHARAVRFPGPGGERRSRQRRDDVRAHAGEAGFLHVDGINLARFGGILRAPHVRARPSVGQGFRPGFSLPVRDPERRQPFLRLRADRGGHGNYTCNVRSAVGIKRCGILLPSWIRLSRQTLYERKRGQREAIQHSAFHRDSCIRQEAPGER